MGHKERQRPGKLRSAVTIFAGSLLALTILLMIAAVVVASVFDPWAGMDMANWPAPEPTYPLAAVAAGMAYADLVREIGAPNSSGQVNSGAKGLPPNPLAADPDLHIPPNTAYGMSRFGQADGTILVVSFVPAEQYEMLTGHKTTARGDVVLDFLLLDTDGTVIDLPVRELDKDIRHAH